MYPIQGARGITLLDYIIFALEDADDRNNEKNEKVKTTGKKREKNYLRSLSETWPEDRQSNFCIIFQNIASIFLYFLYRGGSWHTMTYTMML